MRTQPPIPPPSRAQEFGPRIYTETWERGWSRAENKVVIADGAE
jgi:hypothetical protein